MAQNPSKTHKKKPSNPIVLSHSRSLSTIPPHQNISFMPKFLLKLLQKKKHGHKRSVSIIKADINRKDLGVGVGKNETREKISKIDKHVHGTNKNNYLLQFLPVPKKVSSIISTLSKNTPRSRDHNDHKNVKTIKPSCTSSSVSSLPIKGKLGKNQLPCRSRDSDESCDSGVADAAPLSVNKGRISRAKSGKMRAIGEKKGGLRIKGFMKMKRREKEEKRFELCKKKILMGEKCRPLNGSLRYDKNGILVPQDLPG